MDQVGQQLQRVKAFLAEPSPRQGTMPSPFLDRFCIVFLAIDWVVFGLMHFSLHDATRGMLWPWMPFPDTIVLGTGMAEVVIGMLMLYGRTRRIAALGSLALLILYVPVVFHMLADDGALPFPDPASWPNRLWRLLGVPHNVLMAICSLHLLQKPYPDPWGLPERALPDRRSSFTGRNQAALLVAFVLLLCNAAGFLALQTGVHGDKSTAAMWMMMCLAVGGLLGFLFAVPRANKKAANRDVLVPNRNIEAISDWLTKILVGLGLINFKDIGGFLTERAAILAPVLKAEPTYVVALIVYFSVAGFLEGYLLTRMFLQWHFVETGQAHGGMPALRDHGRGHA